MPFQAHNLKTPPIPAVNQLSDGDENTLTGEWPNRSYPDVTRAELHSYTVQGSRGAALICVGGGYKQLVYDKEGTEIALWLNSIGFDAHILAHRLPGGCGGSFDARVAETDGARALEWLAETHSDLPLCLVGISSGGHLAGVLSCLPQSTAKGVIICYAPLNANHRAHKFPKGKPDFPPVEKQNFYDAWPIGMAEYPQAVPQVPCFLAYALADRSVPVQHALRFIETAAEQELDLDAHIFGAAPHGFALRDRDGSHVAWTDLAEAWLNLKI
jgi:dienelactone hydrolase